MTDNIWLNKTEITLDEWHERYLQPFTSDETLQKAIDDYGGFAGWVLDGVLAVKDVGGQWATDHECLELIRLLTKKYLDAFEGTYLDAVDIGRYETETADEWNNRNRIS